MERRIREESRASSHQSLSTCGAGEDLNNLLLQAPQQYNYTDNQCFYDTVASSLPQNNGGESGSKTVSSGFCEPSFSNSTNSSKSIFLIALNYYKLLWRFGKEMQLVRKIYLIN